MKVTIIEKKYRKRVRRKKQYDNQPGDPGGDFSDVVMISLLICGDIFVSSSTIDMLSVVLSMSSNDMLLPRFPLLVDDE